MVDFFPWTSEVNGIQPVLNVDLSWLKTDGCPSICETEAET